MLFVCVTKLTYLLTYLLTYSLTHSMVQDIIWEADCPSACQKILLSYGTRRFVTVFTQARHWTLSWSSWIHCVGRAKESVQVRGALKHFVTVKNFYGEGSLAPRPTPKLEDHPLSAARNCLFNIFTATLRTWRTSLHPQPENATCRGDKGPT
jgi:hypothetical protein